MKKVRKIKNINKSSFFSKKKLLIMGFSSLLVSIPISLTISLSMHQNIQDNFVFDGINFNSISDAKEYVKSNSEILENKQYKNEWELNVNGEVKKFESQLDMNLYINDKYIESLLVKTSLDLSKYENEWGELVIKDNEIWSHIYDVAAKSVEIYQGLNDEFYFSKDEAYKSYFLTKDVFYFNGIYFNSRNELKTYLLNEYLPNNSINENTIILKGPNGINSSPINLTNKNAYLLLSSFIKENSQKVLTYTNSSNNKTINISSENKNEIINDISLNDLDYLKSYSNAGKSLYTIDNDITDSANLIGPFFFRGNLDLGSFLNKEMWGKHRNMSEHVYVQSKIDAVIESFFTSIINDDSSLILSEATQSNNVPPLFRTLLVDEKLNPYDEWFLNQLSILSPALYDAIVVANVELLKGKKYNTFFKIPILYSFLLQRIISWNLSQEVLDLINTYFCDVANFIQDVIEMIVIDKTLLLNKNKTKYFNMIDFFNIGNKNFDTNLSMDYYLNKLKNEYPSFVAAMSTYIAAQNNITSMAGLIPFSGIDNSYLIEFGLLGENELSNINPILEKIYNVFSIVEYEKMVIEYLKSSNDKKFDYIKGMPENMWVTEFEKLFSNLTEVPLGNMLKAIGTKNSSYYILAESVLISEIQIYKSSGRLVEYGYLQKLYSNVGALNKLPLFIDFVSRYPNISPFRVYMAMLIDKRMGTGIFNEQTIFNHFTFAQGILRLIAFTLKANAIVGTTMKSIYNCNSSETKSLSKTINREKNIGSDGNDLSNLKLPTNMPLVQIINENKNCEDIILNTNGDIFNKKLKSEEKTNWLNARKITIDNKQFINISKNKDNFVDAINSLIISDDLGIYTWDNHNFSDLSVLERVAIIDSVNYARECDGKKAILLPNIDSIANKRISVASSDTDSYLEELMFKIKYPKLGKKELEEKMKNAVYTSQDVKAFFEKNPEFITNIKDVPKKNTIDSSNNKPNNTTKKPNIFNIDFPHFGAVPKNPKPNISLDREDVFFNDKKNSNFASWKKIKNSINNSSENINSWFHGKYKDISRRTSNWWSGRKYRFNLDPLTRFGASFIKYPVQIFTFFANALEISFLIYQLIVDTKIKDYYVYTAIDGTEWIWDGGLTSSKFFGFKYDELHGIQEMVLTNPVQITIPNVEEYYYYNSQKYYDPRKLIKEQVNDILLGKFIPKNNSFNIFYTIFSDTNTASIYKSNSIEEFVDFAISDIGLTLNADGTFDYSKINKNSEFIQSLYSSLGNGYFSNTNNYLLLSENISSIIRPTKLAIIPNLVDGTSNGNISNNFVMPGNYWDGFKIVNQDPKLYQGKVLVNNDANKLKNNLQIEANKIWTNKDFEIEDPNISINNSLTNLFNLFRNSFQLSKKNVLLNELNNNSFSDISNLNINNTLYKVSINGEQKYFLDEQKAFSFIKNKLYIKRKETLIINTLYNYKNILFKNDLEIEEYITSNSIN